MQSFVLITVVLTIVCLQSAVGTGRKPVHVLLIIMGASDTSIMTACVQSYRYTFAYMTAAPPAYVHTI